MDTNLKKNTIWNIIGTGINAFTSLFFMIIVTRINDVNEAGVFTFAFSMATLLNVVGTYAGRIYQVTERKNISNNDFLINRVITCLLMCLMAIIFVVTKNYKAEKNIVIILLCFLKMLEAFGDVIYGFLQKKDELYKVGITLTLKNIVGLFVFLLVDLKTQNVIVSIISFIVVYIIITIAYDFSQVGMKQQILGDIRKKNIMDIFKNGFPTFAVTFLNMYIINASKYAIDGLMTDDSQAVFGIIIMPATVMILLAQFMVHPFLNMITECTYKKDYKSINKFLLKITILLALIGVFAVLFCYFIGIYILEFIYGIPLVNYNGCLSVILVGAVFSALTSVIITVLIAMRHTLVQMIVYILVSIIAFFCSHILVLKYEIVGASINYSLIMIVNCVIFFIIYAILVKRDKQM